MDTVHEGMSKEKKNERKSNTEIRMDQEPASEAAKTGLIRFPLYQVGNLTSHVLDWPRSAPHVAGAFL